MMREDRRDALCMAVDCRSGWILIQWVSSRLTREDGVREIEGEVGIRARNAARRRHICETESSLEDYSAN